MEHFFTCPYCWQPISMILDPDETQDTYIEDCEVCCRPIEIRAQVASDIVIWFDACVMEGI